MTEQELRVKFEEWLSNFNNLDFNDDKFSILAWIGFQACYTIMQDTNAQVKELILCGESIRELQAQLAQFSSEPVGIMGETYGTPYPDGYHGNVISKTVIEKHMPLYSRKLP